MSYLKLNLKSTEAHRMSWNGQYFNLEGVLYFEDQIQSKEQATEALQKASLVIKMIPFKNEFKAKLFSAILEENRAEKSQIIAFTAKINIFEKKVLDILDIQEMEGSVNAHGESPLNSKESTPIKLTDSERITLTQECQKLVEGSMLVHLREPFVCFFPEFATPNWKEKLPKNKAKNSLIPFQALFPFAGNFERVYKDQFYILDDLYCVSPQCECNEVNCLIITLNDETGQEVVVGGFKYHFQKKSFKNRPDVPMQINSQEWFKQFSLNHPVSLAPLFEARYHFLRKNISE